jgi:hypothetical protein
MDKEFAAFFSYRDYRRVFSKTVHEAGYRTIVPGEKKVPYAFRIQQQQLPGSSWRAP